MYLRWAPFPFAGSGTPANTTEERRGSSTDWWGCGRKTLRLVARFADEWNPGFVDPETFVRKNDLLREYCSMIGRDQSSIRRALMLTFVLGRDRAEVHEKLRRSLAWRGLQEVLTETDFDALLADPQKRC